VILTDGVHLASDESLDELHAFAAMIGLRRRWFQGRRLPHYDVTARWRQEWAEGLGAVLVPSRELVRRMVRNEVRA
jgi:hypothetical protein